MPYLTVPTWDRFDGLVHAFFGAETHPAGGDRATTMAAARNALALPHDAPLYLPDQVHGDRLVVVKDGAVGEADGVIVLGPGSFAGVVTADCCPLLLIAPKAGAAAAVHAGWRGTAAAIAAKAVTRLCEAAGVTPTDLHAAIGPAIGACCYEVGEAVVEALDKRGNAGRAAIQRHAGHRPHADLRAANRALLVEAGLPPGQVHLTGGCTACDTAFPSHSYRRDRGDAGRQLSLVGWRR
jgi:YfiH family protein